jgi:acyl carrier protein
MLTTSGCWPFLSTDPKPPAGRANITRSERCCTEEFRGIMGVEPTSGNGEMMKELTAYIAEKVVKGKSEITEDTPLVSSGLIDSFALIEIFLELQKIAGCKVPASKVQPQDMDTVRLMFATAERFGKPIKK